MTLIYTSTNKLLVLSYINKYKIHNTFFILCFDRYALENTFLSVLVRNTKTFYLLYDGI